MNVVKVSPKYQIVIPEEVRKNLNIRPGERIQVLQFENRIELVPIRGMKEMRGFIRGMDTKIKREKDRI